jgi:4-oxalocrotonate tautomerase
MPIIRVEMFEGRTVEQKRQLVRELTDSFLRTCGSTADAVQVVIIDQSKENWAKAGELFSDQEARTKSGG